MSDDVIPILIWFAQLKVRGLEKARVAFILALAAYDLIRLRKLLEAPPRAFTASDAPHYCRDGDTAAAQSRHGV